MSPAQSQRLWRGSDFQEGSGKQGGVVENQGS